jgi:hypothetical protein
MFSLFLVIFILLFSVARSVSPCSSPYYPVGSEKSFWVISICIGTVPRRVPPRPEGAVGHVSDSNNLKTG